MVTQSTISVCCHQYIKYKHVHNTPVKMSTNIHQLLFIIFENQFKILVISRDTNLLQGFRFTKINFRITSHLKLIIQNQKRCLNDVMINSKFYPKLQNVHGVRFYPCGIHFVQCCHLLVLMSFGRKLTTEKKYRGNIEAGWKF